MKESTSREKVLKSVRNALMTKLDNPHQNVEFSSSVFIESDEPLEIQFAEEFTKVAGKFVFCENIEEFIEQLQALIEKNKWDSVFCRDNDIVDVLLKNDITCVSDEEKFLDLKVGITKCEYLVARLGSVMISSKQMSGRKLNVYPEIHIVMAYTSQLVPDLKHALKGIKTKYEDELPSLISLITGPSRTADIEKTLVMGAHGPKDIYLFLIYDGDVNDQ